jgi:hypothetical protein
MGSAIRIEIEADAEADSLERKTADAKGIRECESMYK